MVHTFNISSDDRCWLQCVLVPCSMYVPCSMQVLDFGDCVVCQRQDKAVILLERPYDHNILHICITRFFFFVACSTSFCKRYFVHAKYMYNSLLLQRARLGVLQKRKAPSETIDINNTTSYHDILFTLLVLIQRLRRQNGIAGMVPSISHKIINMNTRYC